MNNIHIYIPAISSFLKSFDVAGFKDIPDSYQKKFNKNSTGLNSNNLIFSKGMNTFMIDTIFRLYSAYISTRETSDEDSNLFIFNSLIDYIKLGNYTQRKHKKIILNFWMTYNNIELAELLNVTVSTISYAKKDICLDLKKSLGSTLISLIRNEQFCEINQLLLIENDYLTYKTLLSPCLIKEVNTLYESEKNSQEDWEQKRVIADSLLVNALSNETNKEATKTRQILQFTQLNFFPNTARLIKYFDIYQLKLIIDILQKNHGTAELRHKLLNYLIYTPSKWENEVVDYLTLEIYENMDCSQFGIL